MGGEEEQAAPAFQGADLSRVIDSDIVDSFTKQIRGGLLPEQRKLIEGQYAGLQREQAQNIAEQFAGSGTPIATRAGLRSKAESGLGRGLAQDLLKGDISSRQQGLQNYVSLLDRALAESSAANAHNFQNFQAGQQNEGGFDPLAAVGTAATVGSTLTCFCYAEAYGSASREFITARNWGMNNTGELTRKGYMKLSSVLIPLMRKSALFKKAFRDLVASPCVRSMTSKGILIRAFTGMCNVIGLFCRISDSEKEILASVFRVDGKSPRKQSAGKK